MDYVFLVNASYFFKFYKKKLQKRGNKRQGRNNKGTIVNFFIQRNLLKKQHVSRTIGYYWLQQIWQYIQLHRPMITAYFMASDPVEEDGGTKTNAAGKDGRRPVAVSVGQWQRLVLDFLEKPNFSKGLWKRRKCRNCPRRVSLGAAEPFSPWVLSIWAIPSESTKWRRGAEGGMASEARHWTGSVLLLERQQRGQ
jgi:hypothetical protein